MSAPVALQALPALQLPRITKAAITEKEKMGNLGGRSVTPFSFYILIAGALTGAVIAIAAWVLNKREIGFLSLILSGTNLLGAFQIKRLELQKSIEESVDEIENKTQDIKAENSKLDSEIAKLKGVITEYKSLLADKENKLKSQIEKIGELEAQFRKTQANLAKIVEVVNPMQQTIGSFVEVSSQFSSAGLEEKKVFQDLSLQLQQSNLTAALLIKEQDEFEASIASLREFNQQALTLPKLINEGFVKLQQECALIQMQNELFQKKIVELNASNKTFAELLEKMKERKDGYAQVINKVHEGIPSPAVLQQLIRQLEEQNQLLKHQKGVNP